MMALFKVVLALQNANKKLVEIALQMLAEGFSYQKGAIFGFGPSANLGTEITMKSSNADAETLDKFVQVHKILEERERRDQL